MFWPESKEESEEEPGVRTQTFTKFAGVLSLNYRCDINLEAGCYV